MDNKLEIRTSTAIAPFNLEQMILKGIESKAQIEVMNGLYELGMKFKADFAKEQFYLALAKFQKETPAITKTKPVISKGSVKYRYAPLDTIVEQVKEALDRNGFSYTLKTKQADGNMTVICEAHHISGHTDTTEVTVPIGSDYMTKQQMIGAALTFAKRYAFCDAFGIMTGDEDVDANTEEEVNTEVKPEVKPEAKKDTAKPGTALVNEQLKTIKELFAAKYGELPPAEQVKKYQAIFEQARGAVLSPYEVKTINLEYPISSPVVLNAMLKIVAEG